MNLILDFVDPLGDILDIRMALSAGSLRVEQRAVNIVAGIFGGAIPNVRHVTVGAGYARVVMGAAGCVYLIIRMLSLEHGGVGARIDPV